MSKSLIIGGNHVSAPPGAGLTGYQPLHIFVNSWADDYFNDSSIISTPGVISRLMVTMQSSPGVGKSNTFTIIKNHVATALSVTITGPNKSGIDLTNSFSVVSGDRLSFQSQTGAAASSSLTSWSCLFESANPCESNLFAQGQTIDYATSWTTFNSVQSLYTEERKLQVPVPTSGKIKNLRVLLSIDPGTAPDGYRFTLRKNGASTALTCSITANDVTGEDLTHEVSVSAGDLICIQSDPLNIPLSSPNANYGLTFVSDIDGESIVLHNYSKGVTLGATRYTPINVQPPGLGFNETVESVAQRPCQALTIRKLYAMMYSASSGDYNLAVRINSTNALAVTLPAGVTTVVPNIADSYVVSDYDWIQMALLPTGDARYLSFGFVLDAFHAPTVTTGSAVVS